MSNGNHFLAVHYQDTLEPYPTIIPPDPHQGTFSKATLGFWIYLMTDLLLFVILFTSYGILRNNTFGGPSTHDLFELSTPFIETLLLLTSSLTCGFTLLAFLKKRQRHVLGWLILSFILGACFLCVELHEFNTFITQGHDWTKSAFLSSFFTLVGMHGLHVLVGLLWIAVLVGQLVFYGMTALTFRRVVIFSLFWHFLDLIWIFIFTLVYLMGVM